MPERSSRIRFWITASLLAGATILLHAANRPIKVPAGHPLKELPLSLGDWQGIDMPLTDHILAAAGVDDYLNRSYTNADRAGIEVYVGYYSSQKSGELIHSPKNCLPAAGWEWVRKGRIDVQLPDHGTLRINDFRISKSIY